MHTVENGMSSIAGTAVLRMSSPADVTDVAPADIEPVMK